MYMYMNTPTLREIKKHNTTPDTTFSKEKAALKWESNTRLKHNATLTELLRQLSWQSPESPIHVHVHTKTKQSKHLNLIN